jgi:hypothetical protein
VSVLTYINDIPLFSTLRQAAYYGSKNNMIGVHEHVYNGRTGYMAGRSHIEASRQGAVAITTIQSTQTTTGGSGGY